jgi:DNA invertase Pin-like site-specific DNA recombinase
MSSSKTSKQRRVDEVMQKLEESDTLIVTELSRLGRSTAEVIALVNELIGRDIRIIAIKQTLDASRHQHNMASKVTITMFSLMAELERDFISVRTREALRAKKSQGVLLGKPKGTIQKSKFDKDLDRIKELLGYGLSARKIANLLGLTNHIALNTYIRKRRLREQVREEPNSKARKQGKP